jgi:hypothetical protein
LRAGAGIRGIYLKKRFTQRRKGAKGAKREERFLREEEEEGSAESAEIEERF